MPVPLRILIVEDSADDAALALLELSRGGLAADGRRVETADEMRTALAEGPWDAVLSDFTMPGFGASQALALSREHDRDLPFVVVSGTIGEQRAVEMMRAGAADYLLKGNLTRLSAAVEREVRESGNRRARRRAEEQAARQAAALRESEQRLVKAQEVANIGSWENDLATGKVTWSAQTYRMFGVLRDTAPLTHQAFLDLVHPDDLERVRKAFLESLTYCSPGETTYRIPLTAGTLLFVEEHWQVESDEWGKPVRLVGTCQDVTQRVQSLEILRQSEERYRTLIDASAAIVWDSPASGEFDSVQPGWTAFTGQTVEQHRSWGWLDAVHPDDRAESARAWGAAVSTRNVYQVEHRLRRADGEYRNMAVRAVPVLDASGSIREWVGVHTDVTERTRLGEQYRAANERLQHVVASSPVVLFTLAVAAYEIRGLNWIGENLLHVLGHSSEAALSPDWWRANVHPEDLDQAVAQADAGLFGHGNATHEYRFRHGDGSYRWTRGEMRLIRDATGRAVEVVGSWSDITERKSLEEQFRQSQKLEVVGQLAGGVAHDFNNLLCVINGYSDLLIRNLPPGDRSSAYLKEIRNAGERSAALTRQLLTFSRKQVVAPKVLDLNAIVADTEKMLRRVIGEDVILTTLLAGGLGCVRADQGQIEQMLMNLAVNARDAMPQGGKLTVETSNVELGQEYAKSHAGVAPGPYVLLAVSDSGCGMSLETQRHIFEPFFTTKEVGKGTGLGLAVVHGVITQAGGHIGVTSKVASGTTFEVYLPRLDQLARSRKSLSGVRAPPKGTETVLLVEDDDGVRSLAHHMLKGFGYTVLEASGGADALRVAGRYAGPIHLLITDVVMPGLSSRQVAEGLAGLHPVVKVLFVSGYTDDAVVRQGILRDDVHFLPKPFSPIALACKIREVLDPPNPGRA